MLPTDHRFFLGRNFLQSVSCLFICLDPASDPCAWHEKKKCLQKNHRTDRFAVTLLGAALAQDNGNVLEGDYLLLAGLMEGS